MGALHEGHLSLVKAARAQSDFVVVSIFVNPLQFGPTEDFSKYPRMLAEDCAKLAAENVDLVFAPTKDDMYPANASTVVEVQGLSERLDGRSRPGHFKGVTTVVTKLFEIVRPELAFFGQKDAAQVAILRKMVADLNMDIQIVIEPTMREKDGLAMSSRNAYLNPEQRKQALVLHRALMRVQTAVDTGEVDSAKLAAIGKEVIAEERGAKLDYFEIVNPNTLEAVSTVKGGALVAVAAWVGATRLIDNVVVHGGGKARGPSLG
jgi:pantoate--beta-alanine ligase